MPTGSALTRFWSAVTPSMSTTPRQYARDRKLFHLPLAVEVDLSEAVTLARDTGLHVFGADTRAGCVIDDLAASGELAQPTMWVLGNEAWGLPPST